jgi:hypothetical protein
VSFLELGDKMRSLGAVSITVPKTTDKCMYQYRSTHSLSQQQVLWNREGGRRGVMT